MKLKSSSELKPGESSENFLQSRKLGKTKYWINGIASCKQRKLKEEDKFSDVLRVTAKKECVSLSVVEKAKRNVSEL